MPIKLFPTTDSALYQWADTLQKKTALAPTTYGLTSALCTSFGTLVANYKTALDACDPGVRNKAAVIGKTAAKNTMKAMARQFADIINGQANVTDQQKAQLGLPIRAMPSPIPPPSSQPLIEIVSVMGRKVSLRFKSTATEGKRGRPAGTAGLQVYSMVGPAATDVPSDWTFCGTTSKTLMDVEFPATVAAGAQVWFVASWVNPKLETGPASQPATTYLQFGNTVVAMPQEARKRRAA